MRIARTITPKATGSIILTATMRNGQETSEANAFRCVPKRSTKQFNEMGSREAADNVKCRLYMCDFIIRRKQAPSLVKFRFEPRVS